MKVRNKGVDITVIADETTIDMAFAASRTLAVCGISTAVLGATYLDPVDTRTLSYYEQTTPCLIAMNARIFDAVSSVLQSNTTMQLFDGTSEAELIQTVRRAAP